MPHSGGKALPIRNRKTELEQARIRQEGKRSEEVRRATTAEQTAIQEQRLGELGGILAQQRASEFGQFIPEEAGRSQVAGLLETSGFRDALTREAGRLGTRSAFELSRQALSDRDLEIAGIGEAGEINRSFGLAGLERRFSLSDQQSSERLSRELGRLGVANTAQGQSSTDKFLGRASQVAQIGSSVATGVAATYLCTKLNDLGLMTEREVNQVHDKVYPAAVRHPMWWMLYGVFAPSFIKNNPEFNWAGLKPLLCDDILSCNSSEQAFQIYKSVCLGLFLPKINFSFLGVK